MIESTSSCTNLSASKPNFLTAQGTMMVRKPAPGMSACFCSQASSRPAMPGALGIPPTPGGRSSTRLLSVTANCPRRKYASRGSVATQFGLPRPAFRYEIDDSCAAVDATLATKSLISKGPSFSYCLSVKTSIGFSVSVSSREQEDQDHPPDREQRVSDGIGHGVAERRHLAFGLIANQAERRRGRAGAG